MRLFLSSSGLILLLSCFCFLKVTAETTAKAVLSEPDDDEPSTQATLKELGAEEPDTAYGYPLSAFAVNCFPNITVPSGYKVLYGFGIPYLDDGNFYNVYTDQKNCPWAFREDGGLIQIMLDSHGLPVVYGPDGRLRAGFAIVKGLTRIARLTNKIFRGTFQNDLIQTQGHGLTEYPKFTKGPVVRCRHSRGIKSPDYLFGLDHPCNLAELDWAKASGSDAKITGGRGLTIASNRVMVPNIGVKISGSDKYYPVYITKIGKASTFDDQGVEIDVLIDFNGSPITVTVNGKINGGFKEVNGNLTLSITTGAKGEPIIDAALTLAEVKKNPRSIAYYTANPFNINNNLNFKTLGIDGYGFAINPMKDLPEPLRIGFSIGNYSLMMPPTFEEGYAMVPYLGVFPPNGPNKWTPVFADVKGSTWAFDETGAALQVLMDREKLPVVYNEQSRTYNGGFRAINGEIFYSNPKSQCSALFMNIRKIVYELKVLGRNYMGYYTIFRNSPSIPVGGAFPQMGNGFSQQMGTMLNGFNRGMSPNMGPRLPCGNSTSFNGFPIPTKKPSCKRPCYNPRKWGCG